MPGQMSYKKEGVLFYSVKNQENGESNSNLIQLSKYPLRLRSDPGQSMTTRPMSDVTGNPRPGTLINWEDYTIPANNADNSGIKFPQINEKGFIQTPEGSLKLRGTYIDSSFGDSGGSVNSIPRATFTGYGTGKFANVTLAIINYDNDGSLLTGGKVPGLRKLQLYSEKWNN